VDNPIAVDDETLATADVDWDEFQTGSMVQVVSSGRFGKVLGVSRDDGMVKLSRSHSDDNRSGWVDAHELRSADEEEVAFAAMPIAVGLRAARRSTPSVDMTDEESQPNPLAANEMDRGAGGGSFEVAVTVAVAGAKLRKKTRGVSFRMRNSTPEAERQTARLTQKLLGDEPDRAQRPVSRRQHHQAETRAQRTDKNQTRAEKHGRKDTSEATNQNCCDVAGECCCEALCYSCAYKCDRKRAKCCNCNYCCADLCAELCCTTCSHMCCYCICFPCDAGICDECDSCCTDACGCDCDGCGECDCTCDKIEVNNEPTHRVESCLA
jgi:hypothetical protein